MPIKHRKENNNAKLRIEREMCIRDRAYPHAEIGAAVCIDVHTGEVLALASEPGYDPNVFTETLPDTVWQTLSPSYLTASGDVDSDPTLPRPLVNNEMCIRDRPYCVCCQSLV